MVKTAIRAATLTACAAALSGCSMLGINFSDDSVQYESSTSRAPLEIPPDLTAIPKNDRYTVPQRPQIVSANAEAAKVELNAEKSGDKPGSLLPVTQVAKVMRDGQVRWVHVNAPAEKVWPVLQDFWATMGLQIKDQDAASGVIQTEWAENKANLPRDIIRGTLGKVLDFVYDTGERDQYRARMERNDDNTCNIYITHRQMVEVLKGKQEDSTIWQPGPSDPQLEAEMLSRLALKLETEFNPEIKPEAAREAAREEVVKQTQAVTDLINDADGKAVELVINEPFDRAWRRAGLAMDRAGFNLVDRDRSRGIYLISYLDSDYEAKKKAERGFFANMFNKDQPVEAPEYRIRLAESDGKTRVTVTGPDGKADTTGAAPKILAVLSEQLR